MNIESITNVEILYNSNLSNKALIKIPNTRFHLLCIHTQTGLWDAYIIEMMDCKRKKITEQIKEKELAKLINYILKNPLKAYKHPENINKFTEEFKTMIINKKRR